uniref:DDE-1 domain-containing protein n=1 Tax=Cuerna arida TaxID=1464854 RepID=A0A1B6ELN4_9HEMI
MYTNSTKGWMTQTLFSEWCHTNFVPSVRIFLKNQNLPQKALLILDNCPGHPNEEDLRSEDGQITALYMPPNVTPFLQAMDQNVIQTVKTSYKKSLLYKVLSNEGSVIQALKNTNLKDVVFNLASAWEKVTPKTIVCSWKKLWPSLTLLKAYEKEKGDCDGHKNKDVELNDLREAIIENLVDDPDNLTTDVDNWLAGEEEEQSQIMTDDEIIADVLDCDDENEVDSAATPVPAHTHTVNTDKALDAFRTTITWAEENGASATDIFTLKRLQESMIRHSFSAKKQKSIKNFFSVTDN